MCSGCRQIYAHLDQTQEGSRIQNLGIPRGWNSLRKDQPQNESRGRGRPRYPHSPARSVAK